MKFVFTGYVRSSGFARPEDWLKRLAAYFGVLEALAGRHEVISIEQIGYTGSMEQKGVQYRFMEFGTGRILFFPFRLHRFIKHQKPDIVLVHGIEFPLQVLQLRWKLGKTVKILVQSHSNRIPGGYKALLQRLADKHIDAYLFTSHTTGNAWADRQLIRDRRKIRELMVGSSVFIPADRKSARDRLGIPQDISLFLWAGRLDKNKDPMTVIKAFLRFVAQEQRAKLYFIYQTNDLKAELEKYLRQHDATAAVTLVGKVEHEAMADWFSSADYFISGSAKEVFGAAVVEAMSCGCIPILSDIPSFRRIVADGDCGFLFRQGSED
ncbi:MAG: glycosyltransferase family 4 protein, partial [Chitinophagaceae bacterium]|nr:glycosyltransferase family 4 protein [Chitinophagaceae bacterium]